MILKKGTGKVKKSGKNDDIKRKRKMIALGIVGALLLALIIYIFSGLPSLEQLENPSPQLASKVYTIDGELLGQFYIENRIETKIRFITCTS